MGIAENIKKAMDSHIVGGREDWRRGHLGPSSLGSKCDREVWYKWRWAEQENFGDRDSAVAEKFRLFSRGHLEELRFAPWLEAIADSFQPFDPDTGNQWTNKDFKGYVGMSIDGKLINPCGHKGKYLCEFKTLNDKNFEKLSLRGVEKAQYGHYVQVQIYMHYFPDLISCIYFGVNKNTDQIHVEEIKRDQKVVGEQLKRVGNILLHCGPPPKMPGAHENNYFCKYFCGKLDLCYKETAPEASCRTCSFIDLTDEGWKCGVDDRVLSLEEQRVGCKIYERGF
jgi:hypothetical protein